MVKRLNNKGFTLVELLAVVVILVVIAVIALPSFDSSIDRNLSRQERKVVKALQSSGELYIEENKEDVNVDINNYCYFFVNDLIISDYVSSDDISNYNNGCVIFNKVDNEYYVSKEFNQDEDICIKDDISTNQKCISYIDIGGNISPIKLYVEVQKGKVFSKENEAYIRLIDKSGRGFNEESFNIYYAWDINSKSCNDIDNNSKIELKPVLGTSEFSGKVKISDNTGKGKIYVCNKNNITNIDGSATLAVGAIDNADMYLDNQKPEVSDLSAESKIIKATLKDSHSKIAHYAVTKSSSQPTDSEWVEVTKVEEYNLEYSFSEYGIYYIWAKDAAGNISDYRSLDTVVKVSKPDNNLCKTLVYNGSSQQLTTKTSGLGYKLVGYYGTNAGNYTITATLLEGYKWMDNTNDDVTFNCSISPKSLTSDMININPTSYTYSGSAKTPTVVVKDGSTTLIKNTDYTFGYSNNINVGTGKVTVTGRGNYTGTIDKTFTINKASSTILLNEKTSTYSGSAIIANTASVTGTKGTVTYTYYTNSSCSTKTTTSTGASSSGAAPKDAGTYYVKAIAAADSNYNSVTSSCVKHVINKKGITVSWGTTTEFKYTGAAQGPSVTSPVTGVSGESVTITRTTSTAVGSHTSTASCFSVSGGRAKCENYSLSNNTKSFTIKAAGKVIVKYDANHSNATISSSTLEGNWKLDSDGMIYVNDKYKTTTIAYGASVDASGLANYNNADYMNVSINESDKNYIAVSGKEWICLSGCTTIGKTFSQDATTYKSSDFCDASQGDCTVVLGVNWVQAINDNRYVCYVDSNRLAVYYITTCTSTECNYSKKNGLNSSFDFTNDVMGIPTWKVDRTTLGGSPGSGCEFSYYVNANGGFYCRTGASDVLKISSKKYNECQKYTVYRTTMKSSRSTTSNWYYEPNYGCYIDGYYLQSSYPCSNSSTGGGTSGGGGGTSSGGNTSPGPVDDSNKGCGETCSSSSQCVSGLICGNYCSTGNCCALKKANGEISSCN